MSGLETSPFAGRLGAVVHGLDVAQIDDQVATALRSALSDHLVLVLPGLAPSREELRSIGALFGELDTHPYLSADDPSVPEVIRLDSSATVKADVWHTDATFYETPPSVALLHMVECPDAGGDTSWINCHDGYASLSPALQDFLLTLTCVHDDAGQGGRSAEHPVVRAHPETGRPALFVHRQFSRRIPQLSRPESQMLLSFLFRWQEQLQFSCRWRWSSGDVVLWDERVTLHAMVNDTEGRRVLHRATVLGDTPEAFAPDRIGERFDLPKTASSGYFGIGSYEF
jgi:taurine dioxygenase